MLRRQPIITVLDPALVSSGLTPDKHPLVAPLWQLANNVRFYGGKVRRRVPDALAFTPGLNPVRGLHQQQTADGVRWAWATSGGDVYRWYGPAPTLIRNLAYLRNASLTQPPTHFDFVSWGDWTVINDPGGAALIFKPTGPSSGAEAVTLLSADAPLKAVRYLKKLNFLLAAGSDDTPKGLQWADADAIQSWAVTESNLAGTLAIEELETRVRAAEHLGSYIALYAEDQLALVSYDATYLFTGSVALNGIGAVGKVAVAGDGRLNYGVSRNGIWRTDGSSYAYIDDSLHDYLQDNVNWSQGAKIAARRNDVTGCFDFSFPMGASLDNNEGWSFDPTTAAWSLVPAFEIADERRLFPRPLSGTVDGKVLYAEYLDTLPGALTLRTKPMLVQSQNPADGAHLSSRVDELDLLLNKAEAVQCRVGAAEEVDGPWTWTDWFDVSGQSTTYKLEHLPSGVYHMLDFRSTATDWTFDLQGFVLFGIVEGTKRGGL